MVMSTSSPASRHVLAMAANALQSGNPVAAEMALKPFFDGKLPSDPDLLNLAGTLRLTQGRAGEAVDLLRRAAAAAPREPTFAFNLGLALSRLGRLDEAEAPLRAALTYNADFVQAHFELGALLHRTGRLDEAEESIRHVLRLMPGFAHRSEEHTSELQ